MFKVLLSSPPLLAKAEMIPVIVVPMFDPKVNGYIRSMDTTSIPTSGVRSEVKIELLCTKKVQSAPIRIARYPVRQPMKPGKSALTNLFSKWVMLPLRKEFKSLTVTSRLLDTPNKDIVRMIRPT